MSTGIYDMPFSEYLKIDAVNKSTLEWMAKSPAHYRWHLENPRQSTPDMNFGGALDQELFGHDDTREYVVSPYKDFRTNAAKSWRDDVLANGNVIITAEAMERVIACAESLREHRNAGKILGLGEYQKTVIWQHQETGLLCKARPDIVVPQLGVIADVKKTGTGADQPSVSRTIAKFNYHAQAAFYLDGMNSLGPPGNTAYHAFVFIFVEDTEPHGIGVYALNNDDIIQGRKEYESWLAQLAECRKTDSWPSYDDAVREIRLPRWARDEE